MRGGDATADGGAVRAVPSDLAIVPVEAEDAAIVSLDQSTDGTVELYLACGSTLTSSQSREVAAALLKAAGALDNPAGSW